MRILTLDNIHYDLDHLPEEVDDMRFAILDNSNPQEPDYHFIPLIFLESFNAPALVLRIGTNTIKMPMDWQILIGEPEVGDLEVLPLTSINDRGFKVFQFNPLTSFRPSFPDIEILDVYHEVSWYAPKLKNGQLLAVPLNNDPDPDCVYFVKDISRNCEIVDYNKSWWCMPYTEPQLFENLTRLVKIYLESYPEDREGLERFLRWAHTQYGYKYGNS